MQVVKDSKPLKTLIPLISVQNFFMKKNNNFQLRSNAQLEISKQTGVPLQIRLN